MLEEGLKLLECETLVDVKEVLMLDLNGVAHGIQDDVPVNSGASVDHDFKLEPGRVTLDNAQVFEEAEHEARHEVEAQDAIQLLFGLHIFSIDEDGVDTEFERVQQGVHV